MRNRSTSQPLSSSLIPHLLLSHFCTRSFTLISQSKSNPPSILPAGCKWEPKKKISIDKIELHNEHGPDNRFEFHRARLSTSAPCTPPPRSPSRSTYKGKFILHEISERQNLILRQMPTTLLQPLPAAKGAYLFRR